MKVRAVAALCQDRLELTSVTGHLYVGDERGRSDHSCAGAAIDFARQLDRDDPSPHNMFGANMPAMALVDAQYDARFTLVHRRVSMIDFSVTQAAPG